MPDDPLMPDGPPAANLDATIARIEAHCAICFRALAARPHERDARLLRALLSLDMGELADLRARRDRLRRGPKLSEKAAQN